MENVVESIFMAFAVIVLVIALSMTTYLLSTAMSATETLIFNTDKTNYLDSIEVANTYTREVGIDTVINSLYRYYKENFMVKIYEKEVDGGRLVQIFDTSIEGKLYVANSKPILTPDIRTEEEKALLSIYGDSSKPCYLFGAPWVGNTEVYAKERVDLYVSGQVGYINNGKVDYKSNNLNSLSTTKFEETFIEYMYTGQTISTEDGIESITGNEQGKNKIVIEYRAID